MTDRNHTWVLMTAAAAISLTAGSVRAEDKVLFDLEKAADAAGWSPEPGCSWAAPAPSHPA